MKRFWKTGPALLLLGALALGCSGNGGSSKPDDRSGEGLDEKYVLKAEPSGAKPVLEVRKEAKDGDEVVIVGRVGGDKKPFGADRAYFTIVDPSLEPCDAEGCDTPWDFL